jgi:L-ascorbate metabolism protein UlaG (beta-lactamase superfamily)
MEYFMKHISLLLTSTLLFLASCAKPAAPAPTPTPTTPPTPIPTAAPTQPPALTLTYQDNAQVELVTPTGRHIYIDVANVGSLTKDPSADDVLLTTHLHNDHYYRDFVEAFPGQQILTSTGKIELPDVTITGIASGHNANDPLLDQGGTNYIYIIEIAGLRIVHFGDIGQEALTDEQLAAIGSVDLAITQFANSFSNMNATNLKGFNLMDQVKPRLVIPTHSDNATIQIAVKRWKGYYSDTRTITLSVDTIPEKTSILVLGNLAIAYSSLYGLELWK